MKPNKVRHATNAARALLVAIAALAVLLAGGCGGPLPSPPVVPTLEVIGEDHGWVQVRVSPVPSAEHRILWGDSETAYGTTDLVSWDDTYEHFYQAVYGERSGEQVASQYTIRLIDACGLVVAEQSVYVATSDCHVELVRLDGREVTVEYWGRFGIEYSISWGDHFADHVMVSTQSGSGHVSHVYEAPGIYAVGMEEIWAPRRTFFTLVIE